MFGWAELIGGYVIQLSKVGGVVASLPHCRSSADTMYTRGHVEWSRQQLRGGGGRGVARAFADSTPGPGPGPGLTLLQDVFCEFEFKILLSLRKRKNCFRRLTTRKGPEPNLSIVYLS